MEPASQNKVSKAQSHAWPSLRNKRAFRWAIPIFIVTCLLGLAAYQAYFQKEDNEIKQTYALLKTSVKNGDYLSAYAIMSPAYQATHSTNDFQKEASSICTGAAEADISFTRKSAVLYPEILSGGAILQFRKVDGLWRCDGIIDWSYD